MAMPSFPNGSCKRQSEVLLTRNRGLMTLRACVVVWAVLATALDCSSCSPWLMCQKRGREKAQELSQARHGDIHSVAQSVLTHLFVPRQCSALQGEVAAVGFAV
eukprot:4045370-Amphidinium_carterae.1